MVGTNWSLYRVIPTYYLLSVRHAAMALPRVKIDLLDAYIFITVSLPLSVPHILPASSRSTPSRHACSAGPHLQAF